MDQVLSPKGSTLSSFAFFKFLAFSPFHRRRDYAVRILSYFRKQPPSWRPRVGPDAHHSCSNKRGWELPAENSKATVEITKSVWFLLSSCAGNSTKMLVKNIPSQQGKPLLLLSLWYHTILKEKEWDILKPALL